MILQIILCVCIGICAVTDILRRTIDTGILLLFSIALLICGYIEKYICIENMLASLCIGILLAAFSLISNGQIGMGDVFLYLLIIFFMGFEKGICIILMSIIFAFFAAIYLVVIKRKNKKYEMPLVPFMFAAYLCSFL